MRILVAALAILLTAAAAAALASDGVLEINQTCAVETGCFAGDSAGWPVTISMGGAYVLTSGLLGPIADTLIDIQASGVDLDLNGHYVFGDSFPWLRTAVSGIRSGVEQRHVTVRDGYLRHTTIALSGRSSTISNFHSESVISCGNECSITHSKITGRLDDGAVICGDDCFVSQSIVSGDEFGLVCGDRCRVESSFVQGQDGNAALSAGHRAQIVSSDINGIASGRVSCGSACQIRDSSIESRFEVACGDDCQIRDSSIKAGGVSGSASLTAGEGSYLHGLVVGPGRIVIQDGSNVTDSILSLAGAGSTVVLEVATGTARYGDSVLRSEAGPPTVSGSVINAGGNVCNGSSTCP